MALANAFSAFSKAIDLSTRSDSMGDFNIAFCGRPSPDVTGKPGHAFVAYSHKPSGKDRDFVAIGHTVSAGQRPADAVWSYFGSPISGLLEEELYTSVKQKCLDVKVNQEDFRRARAIAEDRLRKMGLTDKAGVVLQAYKLGSEDCMTFLMAVADVLKVRGLKVPARGPVELPTAYVERLIEANVD